MKKLLLLLITISVTVSCFRDEIDVSKTNYDPKISDFEYSGELFKANNDSFSKIIANEYDAALKFNADYTNGTFYFSIDTDKDLTIKASGNTYKQKEKIPISKDRDISFTAAAKEAGKYKVILSFYFVFPNKELKDAIELKYKKNLDLTFEKPTFSLHRVAEISEVIKLIGNQDFIPVRIISTKNQLKNIEISFKKDGDAVDVKGMKFFDINSYDRTTGTQTAAIQNVKVYKNMASLNLFASAKPLVSLEKDGKELVYTENGLSEISVDILMRNEKLDQYYNDIAISYKAIKQGKATITINGEVSETTSSMQEEIVVTDAQFTASYDIASTKMLPNVNNEVAYQFNTSDEKLNGKTFEVYFDSSDIEMRLIDPNGNVLKKNEPFTFNQLTNDTGSYQYKANFQLITTSVTGNPNITFYTKETSIGTIVRSSSSSLSVGSIIFNNETVKDFPSITGVDARTFIKNKANFNYKIETDDASVVGKKFEVSFSTNDDNFKIVLGGKEYGKGETIDLGLNATPRDNGGKYEWTGTLEYISSSVSTPEVEFNFREQISKNGFRVKQSFEFYNTDFEDGDVTVDLFGEGNGFNVLDSSSEYLLNKSIITLNDENKKNTYDIKIIRTLKNRGNFASWDLVSSDENPISYNLYPASASLGNLTSEGIHKFYFDWDNNSKWNYGAVGVYGITISIRRDDGKEVVINKDMTIINDQLRFSLVNINDSSTSVSDVNLAQYTEQEAFKFLYTKPTVTDKLKVTYTYDETKMLVYHGNTKISTGVQIPAIPKDDKVTVVAVSSGESKLTIKLSLFENGRETGVREKEFTVKATAVNINSLITFNALSTIDATNTSRPEIANGGTTHNRAEPRFRLQIKPMSSKLDSKIVFTKINNGNAINSSSSIKTTSGSDVVSSNINNNDYTVNPSSNNDFKVSYLSNTGELNYQYKLVINGNESNAKDIKYNIRNYVPAVENIGGFSFSQGTFVTGSEKNQSCVTTITVHKNGCLLSRSGSDDRFVEVDFDTVDDDESVECDYRASLYNPRYHSGVPKHNYPVQEKGRADKIGYREYNTTKKWDNVTFSRMNMDANSFLGTRSYTQQGIQKVNYDCSGNISSDTKVLTGSMTKHGTVEDNWGQTY